MDIRIRRTLYSFFIALFFLVGALILGYARGFRYNLSTQRITKTGLIIVNSAPDKADVWVNGKKQKETTLAYIKNLEPGAYDVRVEKEGYFPWTKSMIVRKGEATIADSITLFRRDDSGETVAMADDQFLFHPYSPFIIYQKLGKENEIRRYHAETENDILLRSTTHAIQQMTLSPLGNIVLVAEQGETEKEFFLCDARAPKEAVNIGDFYDEPLVNVSWSLDSDDLLLVQTPKGFSTFTLSSRRIGPPLPLSSAEGAVILTSKGILHYQQNSLFIVTETGEQEAVLSVPHDYEISGSFLGAIALSSLSTSTVYLLEDISKRPIRIEEIPFSARGMMWRKDGKELLMWNSVEIALYSRSTTQTETLGRYSIPLHNVQFFPDGNVISFQQENGDVVTVERDGRDRRNSYTLARGVEQYAFSSAGEKLYTATRDENGRMTLKKQEIQ